MIEITMNGSTKEYNISDVRIFNSYDILICELKYPKDFKCSAKRIELFSHWVNIYLE